MGIVIKVTGGAWAFRRLDGYQNAVLDFTINNAQSRVAGAGSDYTKEG